MAIQAINSTNISFKGSKNKTERGNEYQVTHSGRTLGGLVGVAGGGLVGKLMTDQFKTYNGKYQLVKSLNNIGKSLNSFGTVRDPGRHIAVAKGIKILAGTVAAIGLVTGAIVGSVIDSHKNTDSAKLADKAAEKVK